MTQETDTDIRDQNANRRDPKPRRFHTSLIFEKIKERAGSRFGSPFNLIRLQIVL
jgi:hypothetical protein